MEQQRQRRNQVSISSTLNVRFFVRMSFWQLLSSYMQVENAPKKTFVRKICAFNVDEIDGRDIIIVGAD
jgi:hypothetical protein